MPPLRVLVIHAALLVRGSIAWAPAFSPPQSHRATMRRGGAVGRADRLGGGGVARAATETPAAETTTETAVDATGDDAADAEASLRANDPLLWGASLLIRDPAARRATVSIYRWCRRADDIADGGVLSREATVAALDAIEADLGAALDERAPRNALDAALLRDAFDAFPALERAPFAEMLVGMRTDLADADLRFARWDPDLRTYCERVAGGVGLMLLPVLGVSGDGEQAAFARARAVDLGVAIQLTNILRDVGGDARELRRVYLPLEDLAACRAEVGAANDPLDDVLAGALTPAYKACVRVQITRARELYDAARAGAAALPRAVRLPVFAIVELLSAIVDEIERRDCDNLSAKVQPPAGAAARALYTAWRAAASS